VKNTFKTFINISKFISNMYYNQVPSVGQFNAPELKLNNNERTVV